MIIILYDIIYYICIIYIIVIIYIYIIIILYDNNDIKIDINSGIILLT